MGRPSKAGERRAQIADALISVMAARGFDGASIVLIAEQAGLRSGLVHHYFADKHEILLAAVARVIDAHDAVLGARLEAAGDSPEAQLDTFIEVHLGAGADADPSRLASWVVISAQALSDQEVAHAVASAYARWQRQLRSILSRGVSDGVFVGDENEAAGAIIALVQGYFVVAATARAIIPEGSAAANAKRMVRGLLTPPL